MTTFVVNPVVDQIHRVAGTSQSRQSDQQLLERFSQRHEQSAFAALVRRHGAMVFGVCRRVLHHHQDAEDAFQATFMVLARKAGAVHWKDSIANWLYGVAFRLSMKLRSTNARRLEIPVGQEVEKPIDNSASSRWQNLQPILDEELSHLPEKYSAPLILCYLEGKTRDEAAQHLGWTIPMVKGRLERGRKLLRSRLNRRGLALSAVLVPLAMAEKSLRAAIQPALVRETVAQATKYASGQALSGIASSQVLTLAEGVCSTMFWQNTKSVLASLVILAFLGTGVGLFTTLGIPGNSAAAFLGDEGEGEGKRLYGILEKIDVEKGTLVLVTQRDGEGRREHVLSLAGKDIKITGLRERKISLKDLARGQRLTVFLSPASDVTAIRIGRGRVVSRERGDGDGDRRERRRVIGFLKSVNEKERSITIRQRSDAGNKEKTLILGKEAQIRVREGSNKLSDLQPEMILGLYLSEDGKTIREVRLIRGVRRQPQPRRPEGFFRGYVHGVGENTIIIGGRNERGDRMTLTVAKNAVVSLKGKDAAKLTDIKKGTLVFLLMSPNKREVIAVREVEGSLGGDRERFENEGDAPRRDRERDEREGGEGGSPRRDPERDEREGGENGAPRDRE